jgi:lactoylglutathione lyase
MSQRVEVIGLAHIGIRVHDYERSRAFYEQLGFVHLWGPVGPEKVAAMRHESGLELNFIVNAPDAQAGNILMDVPEKHAGVTHFALRVPSIASVEASLSEHGIPISGRRGESPTLAVFVRDPDRNVIELAAD